MGLLRAAFECDNGVIELVVLCTGCYSELTERVNHTRRWHRDLDSGVCAFCEAEIRNAARGTVG